MYSIRKRLNLTILAGMVILLSATACLLYLLIARQVETVFDGALYDKAQAMISLSEMEDDGSIEFDFTEAGLMPEFVADDDPQYYQLWDRQRDAMLRSPSLGAADLPLEGVADGRFRYADLRLLDGRAGRLIEIGFTPRIEAEETVWEAADIGDDEWKEQAPPEPRPIVLVFARERESLDETLLAIGLTIGGVIVIMIALAALLVPRIVGNGLSPLSRLAEQVGKFDESRLDQRVAGDGERSAEIEPIRRQLNRLLERLQSAFEREKRFSSNVAHELRTPLSELKTLAEVGAMVPEDHERIGEFFRDVGEISRQMEQIVITLLELARSDAGLLRSEPEDILLGDYCDLIWEQAINGKAHGRRLHKTVPADLVINTDREKLGMILTNLFVNAVNYSPDDSEVELNAVVRDRAIALEVRNAATDLRPEDIRHMRDRFWRKQSRPDGLGHSGLGLSLVDALARIMRLDVDLQLDRRGIFVVSITGFRLSTSG